MPTSLSVRSPIRNPSSVSPVTHSRRPTMARRKPKPLPPVVENLLAQKSQALSRAQAFATMGLTETAGPLWATAAAHEERLAPLLDGLGHELDAAVHRISAASCYVKAGDFTRAS